ncbi:MAG TPA: hypothetical protein VFO92_02640 [Nitrososphaeraceae archaeon]|nr:hypothetical protein [Nitrososphaeraceae archaeon]
MASDTSESNSVTGVVYFGVININEGHRNIGSVDIWRSVVTKEFFCEEKRIGALDISDKIGLHKIDKTKKWAIAVNRIRRGTNRWKLVELGGNGHQQFMDPDDESIVKVNSESYTIVDSDWWSFLVEHNINRTVDVAREVHGNAPR